MSDREQLNEMKKYLQIAENFIEEPEQADVWNAPHEDPYEESVETLGEEKEQCANCGGTGQGEFAYERCEVCGGTGQIEKKLEENNESLVTYYYIYTDEQGNNTNIRVHYNETALVPSIRLYNDNRLPYSISNIMFMRSGGSQQQTNLFRDAIYDLSFPGDAMESVIPSSAEVLDAIREVTKLGSDINSADAFNINNRKVEEGGDDLGPAAQSKSSIVKDVADEKGWDVIDLPLSGDEGRDYDLEYSPELGVYLVIFGKHIIPTGSDDYDEAMNQADDIYADRFNLEEAMLDEETQYAAFFDNRADAEKYQIKNGGTVNQHDSNKFGYRYEVVRDVDAVMPEEGLTEVGAVKFDDYGVVESKDKECDRCLGLGRKPAGGEDCPECHGTGICPKLNEDDEELPPIHAIARDIIRNWKKVNFGAVPYLDAMQSLSTKHDDYGADSGSSILAYGLSNMTHYSGRSVHDPELAKKHREQLKRHLKEEINLCGIVEAVLQEFPGLPKDYEYEESDQREMADDMDDDFEKDYIDPEIEDEELGLRFD